jgi:lysophospholipase L1-like esterase
MASTQATGSNPGAPTTKYAKSFRNSSKKSGLQLESSRLWLIVLLMVSAAGCDPEIGKVIALMGDSTSTELLEELHFAAAARDKGDLVLPLASIPGAALGRDNAYFTGRSADAQAREVPIDAVVISLGTNDTGDGQAPLEAWIHVDTQPELDAAIDALLGALPAVPVVWILPGCPACNQDRLAWMQAHIQAAALRHPSLTLMEPAPEWFQGTGADGVHFTVEGEAAAATAIVAVLDQL